MLEEERSLGAGPLELVATEPAPMQLGRVRKSARDAKQPSLRGAAQGFDALVEEAGHDGLVQQVARNLRFGPDAIDEIKHLYDGGGVPHVQICEPSVFEAILSERSQKPPHRQYLGIFSMYMYVLGH